MKVDLDTLAELEEERAFLLRSLDDLERERAAGDIDEHDYETLRDGYTARAAVVIRALDEHAAALPSKPPRRWGRIVAWSAGVVVLAILAGVAVAAFSGQRLPGGTATGDIASSVNTKLSEARALQSTDPKGAIDRYDAVLAVQPDNPEALTYRGWLVALVGNQAGASDLVAKGETTIDRAIQVAPTYADPYCFRAIIRFGMLSDASGAKAAIDTCVASNPPQVVRSLVEGLQTQIDAAIAAGPAASTTTTP